MALAVASSYHDVPVDPGMVMVGEVGLGGEVRRVGQLDRRLHEAAKLGFTTAVVPARSEAGAGPAKIDRLAAAAE